MTGVRLYTSINEGIQISSACYGSMVWDTLCDTEPHECLLYVGAFGSFPPEIRVGDIIIPHTIHTGYLRQQLRNREIVKPDEDLLKTVEEVLISKNIKYHKCKTGTVFGVYDENISLKTFVHKYYKPPEYSGIECETAIGLAYGEFFDTPSAAILYCFDNPSWKLVGGGLKNKERRKITRNVRKTLNRLGVEILRTI
jgi:purine-nucleoside phosphorylase